MSEQEIGKITHYFSKISVGVVELSGELKVGDTIKIVGHGREFTQKVESMQIEHKNVEKAGKGESIGLKVDQPVKEGDIVYKITE
ncbi:MAG: U32 family peptidase C-terminal domain-containing protein [Patescibacteria group bacterium]